METAEGFNVAANKTEAAQTHSGAGAKVSYSLEAWNLLTSGERLNIIMKPFIEYEKKWGAVFIHPPSRRLQQMTKGLDFPKPNQS